MASIPGFRFDITGASGTQGLLSPQNSWRAYILPRGGHASQDSTGTLITFDSADVASRFAVNDWFQAALLTANIRQVSAVGGNSIAFSGAAMTVSENDRIFLIGTTQPTVSGGSATYTVPATIVRQRDDDGSTIFTNSAITSNFDGLIQGFAATNFYDAIIQDGNQANQGFLVDISVGVVEGVSVSQDALFGASLTVNGALGVTGVATFGSTVTMNAALDVTGWATFGSTVTMNSTLGVTGVAVFGDTVVVIGTSGNYQHSGTIVFGNTLTLSGALGVTGHAVFGVTATVHGFLGVTGTITGSSDLNITGDIRSSGGFIRGSNNVSAQVISGGIITVTQTITVVATEGAASTDDLDTINGGVVGAFLVLRAENDAQTVVCKDGSGNLQLAGDFSLDNRQDKLFLLSDGTNWAELSRSDNGA